MQANAAGARSAEAQRAESQARAKEARLVAKRSLRELGQALAQKLVTYGVKPSPLALVSEETSRQMFGRGRTRLIGTFVSEGWFLDDAWLSAEGELSTPPSPTRLHDLRLRGNTVTGRILTKRGSDVTASMYPVLSGDLTLTGDRRSAAASPHGVTLYTTSVAPVPLERLVTGFCEPNDPNRGGGWWRAVGDHVDGHHISRDGRALVRFWHHGWDQTWQHDGINIIDKMIESVATACAATTGRAT